MRRDNNNWDAPDTDDIVIATDQLTITRVQPERQLLISGVNARESTQLELVGWPGDTHDNGYALVLRRDRILEVNGAHREDGWNDTTQCAVSDVTDGLAVFEIAGRWSLPLLKRGGFTDLSNPSQSVARHSFGKSVLLYQTRDGTFRLHVSRSYEQAMRQLFKSHSATLDDNAASEQSSP